MSSSEIRSTDESKAGGSQVVVAGLAPGLTGISESTGTHRAKVRTSVVKSESTWKQQLTELRRTWKWVENDH